MKDFDKLRELLDEQMIFPDYYTFKFIVPNDKMDNITQVLGDNSFERKESKNGKYISLTCRMLVKSSDEIICVYEEACKIDGLLSL